MRRAARAAVIVSLVAISTATMSEVAFAAADDAPSIDTVIKRVTREFKTLLLGLSTLYLTLGGIRYCTAGGDPAQVEKAKGCLKYAGAGFGIGMMAPELTRALQGVFGG